MTEDFKGYPPSVTELRSEADGLASTWTPRDAVISLLRQIDEGKINIESLVICYLDRDATGVASRFVNASPNVITSLGLLSRITHRLNSGEPT